MTEQPCDIIRITEEIWTGKKWKKIKQYIKRERMLTLKERMNAID